VYVSAYLWFPCSVLLEQRWLSSVSSFRSFLLVLVLVLLLFLSTNEHAPLKRIKFFFFFNLKKKKRFDSSSKGCDFIDYKDIARLPRLVPFSHELMEKSRLLQVHVRPTCQIITHAFTVVIFLFLFVQVSQ
jgi:ribosomal protein S18